VANSSAKAKPLYQPNKMVRTDTSLTKIDAFYRPVEAAPVAPVSAATSSTRGRRTRAAAQDMNVLGAFAMGGMGGGCPCCPAMSGVCQQAMAAAADGDSDDDDGAGGPAALPGARNSRLNLPPLPRSSCEYTSVQNLVAAMDKGRHEVLTQVLRQHVFVGCVDAAHSLIQVKMRSCTVRQCTLYPLCSSLY
jgi:hypothetical protein